MWRANRRRIAAGWMLAALLVASAGLAGLFQSEAKAQAKRSDSVVKVSASADKPGADGNQVVSVTLAMDKGWHTYANPVGLTDLADVQTVVTVNAKAKPEVVKIEYPEGKVIKDTVLGDYKVYEDTVTIKATVRRAKGDNGPLDVSVKLQACTDKQCLLPATVKVSVP